MVRENDRAYKVGGTIVDANSCREFKDDMAVMSQEDGDIILDFDTVRSVDSTCMVILVETHKTLMERGFEIKLINIHNSVYEKLTITRLDAIISCTRKRN